MIWRVQCGKTCFHQNLEWGKWFSTICLNDRPPGKEKNTFSTQDGKVVAQRGMSANHQSRECACPSSWLVSHMPAGYETLPFPHNCLFVTSFPIARPAMHQHQWFMTSFNQALVGHGKREREKTHPTLSLLWATYINNDSLEKLCESPPHLSSVGSECSGNSYWGCHFYWGHLFEGQTPWELRRTERGKAWMQLLRWQVTLSEFSRQWGCSWRFPEASLASGLKELNKINKHARTHIAFRCPPDERPTYCLPIG